MLDGLPALTDLSSGAIVAFLILLIAVGRLVPRRSLEDVIKDREYWRQAHQVSEQARAELAGQVQELLEHGRTTDAFIRAVTSAPPHPEEGAST